MKYHFTFKTKDSAGKVKAETAHFDQSFIDLHYPSAKACFDSHVREWSREAELSARCMVSAALVGPNTRLWVTA